MASGDVITGFPYIASKQARVLILGSMPGERSLREGQYYAHPHNAFWPIMGELFGAGLKLAYEKRLVLLRKNGVALWDVAFQCRRAGSLDTEIRDAVPNDFRAFFAEHPRVRTVFFNGHKSEQLFRRLVGGNLRKADLEFIRLPSTSPAHASRTRAQKIEAWREVSRRISGV